MRTKHGLWPAFTGCPLALWTAFPSASAGRHAGDYYGGSVVWPSRAVGDPAFARS